MVIAFVIYAINMLCMASIFIVELVHAYKMYSIRRKFMVQYGRKQMIQTNYFKGQSSRDDVFPPINLDKLGAYGDASRDNFSPSKNQK